MKDDRIVFQPNKISTIERFLKPITQDELKKLCPELFKNKKP